MKQYILPIVGIAILVVLGFTFGFNSPEDNHHDNEMMEHYEIAPGHVVQKIQGNESFVLLDVRTPEEYEEIHIEGARLLPVDQISAESLADIGLGENAKDQEIVIYCRSGARSKIAYDLMTSLGYTNLKSVAGGMIHWQEDGYPFTEMGEHMGMMDFDDHDEGDSHGAEIAVDRDTHDFGEIPQSGGIVQTNFMVSNTGSETLEIGKLSTSCGCTTAEISSKSIAPGGEATLAVYFDPNFHEEPQGKITRTVFIPSNDEDSSEIEVKIQVDILENQ